MPAPVDPRAHVAHLEELRREGLLSDAEIELALADAVGSWTPTEPLRPEYRSAEERRSGERRQQGERRRLHVGGLLTAVGERRSGVDRRQGDRRAENGP